MQLIVDHDCGQDNQLGRVSRAASLAEQDWQCLLKHPWLKLRAPIGVKLLDLPLRFPARRGLEVTWTGVENHFPEPPGLDAVATLLGQSGEIAQSEVAVDARVDATELVGSLERQDPPPAGFGLGGLAGLAMDFLVVRSVRCGNAARTDAATMRPVSAGRISPL